MHKNMRTFTRVSLCVLFLLPLEGAGCAGSEDTSRFTTGPAGAGGGGAGGASAGGTASTGLAGQVRITQASALCGNGDLDPGEECDDGNTVSGDGCNAACQIEADYTCPTPGRPCVSTAICGDDVVEGKEQCDDGNTVSGDGCSSDCQIESGWECRVPGKPCVPLCGDGVITKPEQCDDGNTVSGDGCSNTCLVEPGWTCTGQPSLCTKSVCGNGIVEGNEACDKGSDNGLFLGDGTGCSKTCTPEPNCRPNGKTTACKTACGDGNIDPGEQCDDGNTNDGDGCDHDCNIEPGFTCTTQTNKDTQDCSTGGGQCLKLPIQYRDFDPENQSATGHPDFFFYGAEGPGKSSPTTCVPNASGHPDANWSASACSSNDSTALCQGLVEDALDSNGKPVAASKLACDCRFTDWDAPHILAAGGTDVTSCTVTGDGSTRYRIATTVNAITSASTFDDWYHDTDKSIKTVGAIELSQIGTSTQYQFAGNKRTIYDDVHDVFLGNKTTLDNNGFFPLDANVPANRVTVCNIWPYWDPSLNTNCAAGAGLAIATQWDPRGWNGGTANPSTGCGSSTSQYATSDTCSGAPIPGNGATTSSTVVKGVKHNFYFTSEVRYYFKYVGGEQLEFFGDDAVWVFINGIRTLDLGAPHERLQGSVTLSGGSATYTIQWQDAATGALTTAAGGTGTVDLNMQPNNIYEIAVFHADQHPRESNYQLTLSAYETTISSCQAACGDGIQTPTEQCDCGVQGMTPPDGCNGLNNGDTYGGCTADCQLGPYCGDGIVQNPPEDCDNGTGNNNALYSPAQDPSACTSACKFPHYCGDGIIDSDYGEECDDGANNGAGQCQTNCRLSAR